MSKADFIDGLGKSLMGKVDDNEYRKQIEYYSSYISREVASGRSEEDVIAELGDPRLIAKTIVHTYTMKDNPINNRYRNYDNNTSYEEENFTDKEGRKGMDKLAIKRLLYTIIVICVVLFLVSFVLKLFSLVLPIILFFVVLMVILRFLKLR